MSMRKKAEALEAQIREDFPEILILYKEDAGWYKAAWYLRVIALFQWLAGLFSKVMRERLQQNFSHGIKNAMVFPNREDYGDWSEPLAYMVATHEYRHLLDMKKHPIWFPLSYLIILPVGITFRAYWEIRGYTASMLAVYEIYGQIPEEYIDTLVGHFTSANYLWMLPFPSWVRRILERKRDAILKGEITIDMKW